MSSRVDPSDSEGLLDQLLSDPATTPVRHRRRWPKVLIGLVLCGALAAGATAAAAWYLEQRLAGHVGRIPGVFSGLSHRPVKPAIGLAKKATNVLIVGSDRRSTTQTTGDRASSPAWLPGAQRSDTLMLVHISGDRRNVTVVSIPRDSWVDIPGYGPHKVNAAYSYAGPALTIQTVEHLTGIRIDHLAVVDWDGFRRLTDALGGVTVDIPHTVYDSARHQTWTAGWHHLNGSQALLYVRQRHGLVAGDLDRVQRQQNLLRLLMAKAFDTGLWSNPLRRYRIMDAVTANLTVDSGWTTAQIRHLGRQLSHVDPAHFYFTTAPVSGTGREGAEDVVFLDASADRKLWRAINDDHAPRWFRNHRSALLPTTVN